MSRVVVKKTKNKSFSDVSKLFNDCLLNNTNNIDLNTAWIKYNKYKNETDKFLKVLKILCKLSSPIERLQKDIENLESNYSSTFSLLDLSTYVNKLDNKTIECSDEIREEFISKYVQIKKQNIISTPIKILSHLKDVNIENEIKTPLGCEFILCPKYDYLNIALIYNSLENEKRKLLIQTVEKLKDICTSIYCILMRPDIDMGVITGKISLMLDDIKKQIPRCNEAFEKLNGSLELLNENFEEYYKEYMCTNSETSLLQSFVEDVNNSIDFKEVKLKSQFYTIINFFKDKIKNSKKANEMFDNLFSTIDNYLQEDIDT